MSGQLVGSAEALGAAWKLANVRLLARVGANVSGLMLETVEGFGTDRTLVRSRQILSGLFCLRRSVLNGRRHQADASGSHGGAGW
jgi:hypothetical protein